MITGHVQSHTAQFITHQPGFSQVKDFLDSHDLANLTVGRHELPDGIIANVQSYQTKTEEDGRWESHQKHIDYQFIVSGMEYIRVADAKTLTIKQDRLAEKDALYYEHYQGPATQILLHPNEFAIMFPEDAHEACLNVARQVTVEKIVFKIPINLLS
jgi:YhcH/YjgK/YiaL family protein